jgi:hypothetical protein
MMQPYPHEIEQAMKKYYATLSEKDRRRYAAVEALKLRHGAHSGENDQLFRAMPIACSGHGDRLRRRRVSETTLVTTSYSGSAGQCKGERTLRIDSPFSCRR